MNTQKEAEWGKRFSDWIGEACFGCLESNYIPRRWQKRLSTMFVKRLDRPEKDSSKNPSKIPGSQKTGHGTSLFVLIVFCATFPLTAQELLPNQKWIEQADAGFVLPASTNVASVFNPGLGGDILVGYRFDRNFSISTDLGFYQCDQKQGAGEWIYVPLMEVARYNFGLGSVRPFVFLGIGAVFNSYSQSLINMGQSLNFSQQETDLMISPGVGVLFVVYSNAAIYLQTRMDMDFTQNHTLNSPAADNPSIFIPVKAGLSFFVL